MRGKDASNAWFVLGLAAGVLLLRLAIFDFGEYFERRALPNHDLYQGAGLFCPSMHSMRLSGDLAWWNPAGEYGGYAQSYNAFLSPLAPTNGHVVTIVWAQMIGWLAWLGIAIPEYIQYLVVNLVILPFLAYLGLAYLAHRLFRSRTSVAMIVIVYAFSGLGLWTSAWFFYQEPATLFFLLATSIAVCKRPTAARGAALLAAVLVQVASANYWTMYNSWFVAIFLGTYGLIYRNQVKRLAVRALAGVRQRPKLAGLLALACSLTLGIWLATLGSVLKEQRGNYLRFDTQLDGRPAYSEERAQVRVREMRSYTTELFNPKLSRALNNYRGSNGMHHARYLGGVLLPLLALFWFVPLRRRELWLLGTCGLTWLVCLAPPWLVKSWAALPLMHNIVHLFYFYTHHLQFLLVLLAATVLDRILSGRLCSQSMLRLNQALRLWCVLAVLVLVGLGVMTDRFSANDPALEAMLLTAVSGLVGGFVAWQCLIDSRRSRRLAFCSLLLGVLTADLTRYYWEVSLVDQQFTLRRYWQVPGAISKLPLSSEIRVALKRPWTMREDSPAGLFENMPMPNHLWPSNIYNRHRHVHEWNLLSADARQGLIHAPLALHSAPSGTSQYGDLYHGPGANLRLLSRTGTYNHLELKFHAPQAGIAVIGLLPDPGWRVMLDGRAVETRRANVVAQSLPVRAGTHRIQLSYEPLSRRLYWPACWALEGSLLGLLIAAVRTAEHRPRAARDEFRAVGLHLHLCKKPARMFQG